MSLTVCTSLLNIKDQLADPYSTAELTFQPRKSQVNTGDAIYINKIQRSRATPGIEIQDLTYISTDVTNSLLSVIYNSGGTAGSEVVTVVGNAISVSMQTSVSTATQIKAAIDASAPATALVRCILSGTGATAQTSFSPAASLSDSMCVMDLAETTTNLQQSIFTLEWNDGSNYASIVFDPIQIPNQSYVDLSTIVTVSRG